MTAYECVCILPIVSYALGSGINPSTIAIVIIIQIFKNKSLYRLYNYVKKFVFTTSILTKTWDCLMSCRYFYDKTLQELLSYDDL